MAAAPSAIVRQLMRAVLTIGNGSTSARPTFHRTLTVKGQLSDTQSHAVGVTMNAGTAIVLMQQAQAAPSTTPSRSQSSYDGGQSPRRCVAAGVSMAHQDRTAPFLLRETNAQCVSQQCIKRRRSAAYRRPTATLRNIGDSSHNALNILLDNKSADILAH